MGRSPCCDKGVKKGPWTPEEDIALVSYIQQHGPGNWRAVPIHTGLMRCSKSCRLRWTNYLRPGIKRGNFTPYEDRMIVHLQALLGNRWAAIASYLPQRTDNDIKNYWNTHLKKRLKKMQMEVAGDEINRPDLLKQSMAATSDPSHHHHQNHRTKGQWESRLQTDIHHAKQALLEALNMGSSSSNSLSFLNSNPCSSSSSATTALPNPSSSYAASVENLSRLLEGWNKHSPPIATSTNGSDAANRHHLQDLMTIMNNTNTTNNHNSNSSNNSGSPSCSEGTTHCNSSSQNSEYQSFFNNNNNNSNSNKNSTCEGLVKIETEGGNAQQWASPFNSSFNSPRDGCEDGVSINETEALGPLSEQSQMPLTMLEKWLMEESLQEHLNRTSSSAQIQMGMMMEEPFPDALNHTMVNQPTALPINSRLSSV